MPDPALVHVVDIADQPATHVIAIGIGQYDHLPGGSGPLTPFDLDLKQITSPPISARKIAQWFIENFDCPEKPLASVSLVLSEAVPTPFINPKARASFSVPGGTIAEVSSALTAWIERAEVRPDNRIMLYFSGHGIASGLDNLYLLRDFGRNAQNPLAGALNYQRFVTGLATRRPSSQFMLFDSCRSANAIAALNATGGEGIFFANPTGRFGIQEPMKQCPLFSTELDGQARGRPGEASLCAGAFIRAMNGACCKRVGGEWYITTDRFADALTDFQNRELAAANAPFQQPADSNRFARMPLRKLRGVPQIPVFVRLLNKDLAPNVRIRAVRAHVPHLFSDPELPGWKSQNEWEKPLEIGDYLFEAAPLQGGASIVRKDTVIPHFIVVEL